MRSGSQQAMHGSRVAPYGLSGLQSRIITYEILSGDSPTCGKNFDYLRDMKKGSESRQFKDLFLA